MLNFLQLTPSSRELGPLEQEEGITRGGLFGAARDRFAELLQVPGADAVLPPPVLERHEAYQLVLAVHMAALAAVLAHGSGQVPPADPVAVSAFLLARERDHWEAMHARRDNPVATSPDAMAQIVYTATVTGRLDYDAGAAAIERAAVASREHPGQLLKDHALCYPPAGPAGLPHGPQRLASAYQNTVGTPTRPNSSTPASPSRSSAGGSATPPPKPPSCTPSSPTTSQTPRSEPPADAATAADLHAHCSTRHYTQPRSISAPTAVPSTSLTPAPRPLLGSAQRVHQGGDIGVQSLLHGSRRQLCSACLTPWLRHERYFF